MNARRKPSSRATFPEYGRTASGLDLDSIRIASAFALHALKLRVLGDRLDRLERRVNRIEENRT